MFHGDSERSLGYVTFTFPPTEGARCASSSIGASTEGDAFDEIVEVTGQRLARGRDWTRRTDDDNRRRGRTPARRGTSALRIVEIEIYEPLAP